MVAQGTRHVPAIGLMCAAFRSLHCGKYEELMWSVEVFALVWGLSHAAVAGNPD